MPQVLVRGVHQHVLDRLRTRAQQNGRSLEAELRLILQQAAGGAPLNYLDEMERVRQLFAGRSLSDSAELIREDRER